MNLALDNFSLILETPWLVWTLAGIFGAVIGSFLNVLIYRLPLMLERGWAVECTSFINDLLKNPPQDLYAYKPKTPNNAPIELDTTKTPPFNLITPASRCNYCQKKLHFYENIPIISFFLIGGKCLRCKKPIGWRYPIVEIFTAAITVGCVYAFGLTLEAAGLLTVAYSLITLSSIDYTHQLLPDEITLPILWVGLLANWHYQIFTSLPSALLGAVAGYCVLWLFYWIFKLITGKEGMGYGDFKLLAMLGAWTGWKLLPFIVISASLAGTVVGILLITFLGRDKRKPIPFGPYLALGGFLALIWGESINYTYLKWIGVL